MTAAYARRYSPSEDFFAGLSTSNSHVMMTASAAQVSPSRAAWLDQAFERAAKAFSELEASGDLASAKLRTSDAIEKLFRLLPPGMPETDAYVSPEGSICFDWDADSANTLSLMVKSDDCVGYAAFFGGEQIFGAVPFDAQWPWHMDRLVERWLARSQKFSEVNS